MQTNQTPEALIRMARDWQAIATREAAEFLGTPEGAARLVEAKRYGLLADALRDMAASAAAVVNAAREAMDESFEAGNDAMDISIPSHLAAALSLRLDEHDAATKRGGA